MILLKNPVIVTMDANRRVLFGKSILIVDNIIADIAEEKNLRKKYDFCKCKIIDCRNKLALPGLINAHTHVAMSEFKGIGHLEWEHIYKFMFPIEKQLTGYDVYQFARLGILEMIKGGTTCFVDHYYYINEVARAAKEFGLRGVLGHTLMDMQGPRVGELEYDKALSFVEEYSKDELITPCFGPHATETVSPAYLKKIVKAALKRNALVHMHVAQTKTEYDYIRKTYSKTPVGYLRDIGALEPKILAAHCIYLTARDIDILARNNVNVVFTPSSEIICEKLPPIQNMLKSGINVALGTDCVATADFSSPLHEMKKAFYGLTQASGARNQPRPIQMLEMFTVNAAKALGMDDKIGSLEKSKLADVVILDALDVRFNPVYDIFTSVVLCSLESMVDMVMVNGKIVYHNNAPTSVDEKEIFKSSFDCCARIMNNVSKTNKSFRRVTNHKFMERIWQKQANTPLF